MAKIIREILLSGSMSKDSIAKYDGSFGTILQAQSPGNVSISMLMSELVHTDGGTAANIAYTLALLGVKSVLLTSVGQDAERRVEELSRMGIDTSHLIMSKNLPTASFMGSVDNGSGQIGWFCPGAMVESRQISLKEWYGSDSIIVCSAHDPETMERHAREAKEYGIELIADIGQQVINVHPSVLKLFVENAKILMVNESEMEVISQRLDLKVEEIVTQVPICVTTLAEKGVSIRGKDIEGEIYVPAVQDVTVHDPTGAGDAFRSGFLFGYIKKLPFVECARLGCVTASFAIEHAGTQIHSFTMEKFNKRYLESYKELYGT